MPFVKNISLKRKKSAAGSAPSITFSIVGTATGSAGYFTSSNNTIYTGATSYYPIYITLSTASLVGGTPPYTCKWTASTAYYPPGYTAGTDTGSITLETYSYMSERWTATITDSATPPNVVSASIDSIVYGIDFEMVVGNFEGKIGNDNQTFDPLIVPGGPDAPLATINAGIKYAVPDNTYIYVASGTYAENPVINKKIYQIQSVDGETSASLGSGNYFIYATKEFGTSSLRQLNTLSGFSSSVFNIIGVNPSGSIQQALFDIEPSGTIKVLAGVHEISTPISMSTSIIGTNRNNITLDGIFVPTGSTDTYPSPTSILRMSNSNFSMFVDNSNVSNHRISNLALEIYTGSFYSAGDASAKLYGEMISFRIISSSVAYDILTYNTQDTAMQSNNVTDTTHPTERNIKRYITENSPIANFMFGSYAPFSMTTNFYSPTSFRTNDYVVTTLNSQTVILHEAANVALLNPASQSRVRDLYNINSQNQLNNLNLLSRRPQYAKNNQNYGGRSYLKFDGVDEYLSGGQFTYTANQTGSCLGICVFGINTTSSTTNRVIWKIGNGDNGVSIVLTGSRVAINFYATSSGVQSNATMLANVSNGQQYMSEFFFDGGSTNKRVGMALYGTGSLITSSYFSSTQFASDKMLLHSEAGNVYSANSIGAAYGDYRNDNTKILFDVDLGGSYGHFFDGTWALSVFLPGTTSSLSNPRFNKRQTEMYKWARYKYFSSSSFVTRSISADN